MAGRDGKLEWESGGKWRRAGEWKTAEGHIEGMRLERGGYSGRMSELFWKKGQRPEGAGGCRKERQPEGRKMKLAGVESSLPWGVSSCPGLMEAVRKRRL